LKKNFHITRTTAASSRLGLTLLVNPDHTEFGRAQRNNYDGFRVMATNPFNYPEAATKGYTVNAYQEAFIGINGQYTMSTDPIKNMAFNKRQCLWHDEDLSYYPDVDVELYQIYLRKACFMECQAKSIMERCGCLPYYFPEFGEVWGNVSHLGHLDWADTTCNHTQWLCLATYTDKLRALNPESPLDYTELIDGSRCNCPSDCEETFYTIETSQAYTRGYNSTFYRQLRTLEGGEICNNILCEMDALINETYFLNPNTTEEDIDALETADYTIGLQTFSGSDLHEFMDKMYNESTLMHIHFKELGVVKYRKDQLYSELDLMG